MRPVNKKVTTFAHIEKGNYSFYISNNTLTVYNEYN